jgi:predicted alpha-1,2-mannosidase
VCTPFGLAKWTPQTRAGEKKGDKPFDYKDSRIQGIRWSNFISGSAVPEYGSMTLMAMTGDLITDPVRRASRFSHAEEVSTPYFYSVNLQDYSTQIACTATERTGYFRIRFPETDQARILIQPNNTPKAPHTSSGIAYVEILPEKQEITGYNPAFRYYISTGQSAGFSGYFVARFNRTFTGYGTWDENGVSGGSVQASNQPGGFAQFDIKPDDIVEVKIGCSFTSIEQARRNLEAEIPDWDFERIKEETRNKWQKSLNKIEIESRNDSLLTKFYTAMYHALLLPRMFGDSDGSHVGFADDDEIHQPDDFIYYDDYSMWDTYRAQHPLLLLTEPGRIDDFIESLIAKSDQGGWLPIFPSWNSYTTEMIGDHVISMITDAYLKGFRGFDIEKAYDFMVRNALEVPENYADYADGKGRRAVRDYIELGYIPLDNPVKEAFHKAEQVSRTLEYAYDDFCLAQLAKSLGREGDADIYYDRAGNYRNVFDAESGFVRGRWQDGRWDTPFDPGERYPYITEATPWVYTWYVPHDIQGVIDLMNGRTNFIQKLDRFFDNGYYRHDNEPSHQIAYLYSYAGAPWKTQERVREAVKNNYTTLPGGLTGNDDAGQMSAWLIFSAMGFYPVCPGTTQYIIGSPMFEKTTIHLESPHYQGKSFTVIAHNVSEENIYIQSAQLNGENFNRPWLDHSDIAAGGVLEFQMGSDPNKDWGSDAVNAPYSLSQSPGE